MIRILAYGACTLSGSFCQDYRPVRERVSRRLVALFSWRYLDQLCELSLAERSADEFQIHGVGNDEIKPGDLVGRDRRFGKELIADTHRLCQRDPGELRVYIQRRGIGIQPVYGLPITRKIALDSVLAARQHRCRGDENAHRLPLEQRVVAGRDLPDLVPVELACRTNCLMNAVTTPCVEEPLVE